MSKAHENAFEVKIEKIIENYLKKNKINLTKGTQNSYENQEMEILDKQMTQSKLIDDLVQKIQQLIDASNKNSKNEMDQKFERIDQEIANLRQLILPFEFNPLQLVTTRSENNSFIENNDSFLNDEIASSLKKKIKEIQETFNKKTQMLDNMLSMLLEQQILMKQQLSQLPTSTPTLSSHKPIDVDQYADILLEKIQSKIQLINKDYLEEKYQIFKKVVEEQKHQTSQKLGMYLAILDECKKDCDKIEKKLNDHISQFNTDKKKSWIPFR